MLKKDENMDDIKKTPPSFPLIVKDALSIMSSMISNATAGKAPSPNDAKALIQATRSIANNSFWGGVHLNDEINNDRIKECIAHVTDEDLNRYWANLGKSKSPPIIRSVEHDMYNRVPYYSSNLASDIEAITAILKGLSCETDAVNQIKENLRAIAEILILDGNKLTAEYCNVPLAEQKKAIDDAARASAVPFKPKTVMISRKTYYILSSIVVAGSVAAAWYSRRWYKNND